MTKVTIDQDNKYVQICGKYRYNTESGLNILSVVSRRKQYPDVISRDRKESCIEEAIKNYSAELGAKIEEIRRQARG